MTPAGERFVDAFERTLPVLERGAGDRVRLAAEHAGAADTLNVEHADLAAIRLADEPQLRPGSKHPGWSGSSSSSSGSSEPTAAP